MPAPIQRRSRGFLLAADVAASSGEDESDDSNLFGLIAAAGVPFCYGTSIAATQECRTRGGVASLCGFDTYVVQNPGPQLRYRRKAFAGEIFWCYFDTIVSCITPVASFGLRYSGACVYNVASCALTNGAFVEVHNGNAACVAGAYDPPAANACTTQTPDCTLNFADSLIARSITGNGMCCQANPVNMRSAAGNITETLTEEDNDTDAIARLVAATPWSAFAAAAQCPAAYQQRAQFADYDFNYQEAEYRITAAGITPSRVVCVELDLYRRPYGVGAYALFATLLLAANSDGAGNLSITGTVPNSIGFETYSANARYFPPL